MMQDRIEAMNLVQMQMAPMMQKMQGSLERFVPEEGIPITTTSPNPSNGHTLYTPPTRAKHHHFTHSRRFYTKSHPTHHKFRTFSTKTGSVRTGAAPYPT
jgi:hypothetical protein